MSRLLKALDRHLPARVFAHLSPTLDECFAADWIARPHGRHLKMQLTEPGPVHEVNTAAVISVTAADSETLLAFYDESYPGHWFDPRMLESGQYRGIREAGRWLAAAGVHVYSSAYRVAALGNIATAPAHRRRGLGRAVTAAVCQSLLATADVIGLNVLADNAAARTCYQSLGFKDVCEFDEVLLERGRSKDRPLPQAADAGGGVLRAQCAYVLAREVVHGHAVGGPLVASAARAATPGAGRHPLHRLERAPRRPPRRRSRQIRTPATALDGHAIRRRRSRGA
jgi:ribosomal protein S18 acetylase RimI-like enzyme